MIGLKAYEKAETFIDRYSSSFEEYLSSVVNKLRDTDSEYKDIEERIAKLYEDYPRVKAVFDLEQAAKAKDKQTISPVGTIKEEVRTISESRKHKSENYSEYLDLENTTIEDVKNKK